ncbi:PREDICTED: inactive protein RESTRICTED TEV MOVEMENT 2-like [Prunus mume]|uniref:Inactive protein RESTRICTED TEV MOVEMENT 2-like n=1 Tax=Prunus mume TaxID=102107 RepID=A0ABM0PJJ6_PRUMU|nr:PREDICTED: inactive protein RESTRICTED TEV MOVEMENT 2-like [Prunus mume]
MDSNGEVVSIIRSYEDFMPYCKFQREEQYDTYQIPLHGFKIAQFNVCLNDEKETMEIEGQRPLDGTRWSRFRQEFKVPCDVYNTEDLDARFGNGVLSIRLPKKKPSNDASDSVVNKSLLLRLKTSKMAILRIAVAVVVGVAVGGYVIFKCLPSNHAIEKH